MRWLLAVLGGLVFLLGLAALTHNIIVGLLTILIATVLFVGAAIIDAIVRTSRNKPAEADEGDTAEPPRRRL